MKKFYYSKSDRIKESKYTHLVEKQGVESYSVYNNTLLPTSFGDIEKEYFHLREHVQIWDVSAQKVLQIKGKDSYRLVQLLTCRNLSEAKIGRCYYAPIVDKNGYIMNDPIAMKLDKDTWWLSLADSDIGLFAEGIAIGMHLNVRVCYPQDIGDQDGTIAVQGPKSFELMERVFGKKIKDLKFYDFDFFKGHLVARSGWSKQGGFEIYSPGPIGRDKYGPIGGASGIAMYEELFSAGKDLNVKAGCPNLIERIEGGLLSYGNDMERWKDTPYECGLDKLVDIKSDITYLGKSALRQKKKDGIIQKIMGVKIDLDHIEMKFNRYKLEYPLRTGGLLGNSKPMGYLRSAVYSPRFKKVVGIAMINKPYWKEGQTFTLTHNSLVIGKGKVCNLPMK
tara:strand:- start:61 stop:1239 length:1179 start_codon:yes stop_codon:yes gene_type:complete